MKSEQRKTMLHLYASKQETEMIRQRMAELGIVSMSAYLRKMAIDGYIIQLDMTEIRELTQYVKRANETGRIYAADIEDLSERLIVIKNQVGKLLGQFANMT